MKQYQDPHKRLITLAYFGVVMAALFGLLAYLLGKNGLVAPAVCGVIGGIISWAYRHAIASAKHRKENLAARLHAPGKPRWIPKHPN